MCIQVRVVSSLAHGAGLDMPGRLLIVSGHREPVEQVALARALLDAAGVPQPQERPEVAVCVCGAVLNVAEDRAVS